MIWPTLFALKCDSCGQRYPSSSSSYEIKDKARAAGWGIGLKLDGTRARRGGKDYCPRCKPLGGTS